MTEQRACATDEDFALFAMLQSLSAASLAIVRSEVDRLLEEQRAEEAAKGGAQ